MAKQNDLKFAPGVEAAPDSETDTEFFEDLKRPVKRRITTMVDEDIYAELKRRAGSDGQYQTLLNTLLREALFLSKKNREKTYVSEALVARVTKLEKQMGTFVTATGIAVTSKSGRERNNTSKPTKKTGQKKAL